jgi:hypothetical protein
MAPLPVTRRSVPYFPGTITYKKPTARDLYGKPTGADDEATLPAKTRASAVEVMEKGGVRAKRDGLVVQVVDHAWLALGDHLLWRGQEYTIIGLDRREDYTGVVRFATLTAVLKRGEV